jgi:hypothetical protein
MLPPPPSILTARFTHRVFAVDPRGRPEPAVSARARRGTTIAYTLSKPAQVLFTIEQAQKGRRVGRTCQRPSRRNRGRRACTRFVRVGSFAQNGTAGRDRKAWSGKIGRRALKPGRYRLSLTARDAAGNRSTTPRRLSFLVVRR